MLFALVLSVQHWIIVVVNESLKYFGIVSPVNVNHPAAYLMNKFLSNSGLKDT